MTNQKRQRPFARRSDGARSDGARSDGATSERARNRVRARFARANPTAADIEAVKDGLRHLADFEAPPGLYQRICERVDRGPDAVEPSRKAHRTAMPWAVAASVAAVAVAVVFAWRGSDGPDNARPPQAPGTAIPDTEQATALAVLMERSRLAEERRRANLVFSASSGPERLLRARIGGIDAILNEQLLSDNVESQARESLLRDRVDLMNTLTDVERYRQHEFVRQVAF